MCEVVHAVECEARTSQEETKKTQRNTQQKTQVNTDTTI